jgi:predicted DNA-binding protein (MmcQ/YjbR family)
MDKMFALTDFNDEFQISLKCEPEKAILLREKYHAVKPGYHMNKMHWNTITVDGSISDKELCELIDLSYDLVVSKIPKKIKCQFENK